MVSTSDRFRSTLSSTGLMTVAALWLLLATGCRNAGPKGLETERVNYNLAVQRTNEEQLLLNLVRLRYRDIPFFIKVSSISSQVEWEKGASLSTALVEGSSNTFGIGAALRHMEIPTVTYTPLEGKEFSQTLLSPIAIESLTLLVHSGWSIERVLRACVRQLGPLRNAIGAGGPTPDYVPDHARFNRASRLLRELQILGAVDLGSVGASEQRQLVLRLASTDNDEVTSRQDELRELLELEKGRLDYPLTLDRANRDAGVLRIQSRSFMSCLFFLSQGVEVPKEDQEAGLVTTTRDSSGEVFDWSALLGELLRVRSGDKPKAAAVAVRYRDTWFWIDDADLNSKSTFTLLDQLFALQAAPVEGGKPILTLPVGR